MHAAGEKTAEPTRNVGAAARNSNQVAKCAAQAPSNLQDTKRTSVERANCWPTHGDEWLPRDHGLRSDTGTDTGAGTGRQRRTSAVLKVNNSNCATKKELKRDLMSNCNLSAASKVQKIINYS